MSTEEKRILLHMCCGPCAITPAQSLLEQGYKVVGLFYNPNIHPTTEYARRRDGAIAVADKIGFKLLVKDDEYHPDVFLRDVAFREENRCFHCYARRLERTASIAKRGNFTFFTSSLLYSKFQKHKLIQSLGRDMSTKKCQFLYHDFREGWKKGIELSKEWEIYRQQYCGCIYSENERYRKELLNQDG